MKSEMERDILKVLVTGEELKARITEMGAELYEQFHGKNPLFLGVLKGSFVFMADLVRACQVKSDVEFIAVSSYRQHLGVFERLLHDQGSGFHYHRDAAGQALPPD